MFVGKSKTYIETTSFSHFIRKANAEKKKRVYTAVLKRASERQREVIARATRKKRA